MNDKTKPQDDLSIEEILGSIRRIIAEDEEPQAASDEKPETVEENLDDEEPLELTNKIESDGTIVDVADVTEFVAPAPVGTEAPEPEMIDFVESRYEEEMPNETQKIVLLEETEPMSLQMHDDDDTNPNDALLSTSTAEATSAVMAKLARHTALLEEGSSNGATIESMVREILKPMLKSWLDDNLPELVQKMVEREIERLTKHL